MGILLLINESWRMRHDSVVSGYVIPTGILQADDWSTGPPRFGASQLSIRA